MMPLRLADIKEAVTREFKVSRVDLDSDRRDREITIPRHVAYKLAKMHTKMSLPNIGRNFGGRDHTTIISGVRSIDKRLAEEPELRDRFDAINAHLTQLAAANSTEGDDDASVAQ